MQMNAVRLIKMHPVKKKGNIQRVLNYHFKASLCSLCFIRAGCDEMIMTLY